MVAVMAELCTSALKLKIDSSIWWKLSLCSWSPGEVLRMSSRRGWSDGCKNQPQNKFGCTLFTELQGQDTRAPPQIVLKTPKIPYLNLTTQKILAKFFYPPKILESKIWMPKKSLDHFLHLKSRVPLGGSIISSFK